MKTLLTVADIEYLLTQQEKLDKDIREKKGISETSWHKEMNDNHDIALDVEARELTNECRDIWKYWKDAPVDKERIIDEAVDVIHFVMLKANKLNLPSDSFKKAVDQKVDAIKDAPLKTLLAGLKYEKFTGALAITLILLDHYDFTSKDIIDAYNRKNKVNFERMASGNY